MIKAVASVPQTKVA